MFTAALLLIILIFFSFICYYSESPILVKDGEAKLNGHFYVKRKTFYLILSFFLIFLIMGLRDISVGIDTETYTKLYLEIAQESGFPSLRYEVGYVLFNKIIGFFFPSSPQIFFLIIALFISWGYANFISKFSRIEWISVLLFFLLEYFDLSINLTRQGIAIIIILFAFKFLVYRKLRFFLLSVLVAGFFHYTAFLFLPAYLMNYLDFSKKNVLLFFAGSLFLLIFSKYIIQWAFANISIYAGYTNTVYADGNVRLASILNAAVIFSIIALALLNISSVKNYFENDIIPNSGKIMFWLTMCGFFIWIASFQFNQLGRLARYFTVFSIIFIPNLLYSIKEKHPRKYFFWCSLVIIMAICYYFVIVLFRPEWSGVYPYKFFFL